MSKKKIRQGKKIHEAIAAWNEDFVDMPEAQRNKISWEAGG
jgi:hypothetical protein